jgi:hypothetical protein
MWRAKKGKREVKEEWRCGAVCIIRMFLLCRGGRGLCGPFRTCALKTFLTCCLGFFLSFVSVYLAFVHVQGRCV